MTEKSILTPHQDLIAARDDFEDIARSASAHAGMFASMDEYAKVERRIEVVRSLLSSAIGQEGEITTHPLYSVATDFLRQARGSQISDDMFHFLWAKLHNECPQPDNVSAWQPSDTAPKDGSPFYARFLTPMRFKLYSPKSQEFKRGPKGRWQAMNEYGGWDNCGYGPMDWISHEDFQKLPAAPATNGAEE